MCSSNVIIFHGAYGYPEENWFGWLKRSLESIDIECHVPHFPTPDNQSLHHWLDYFSNHHAHHIHPKTILIGHSLGAVFALRWLEQYDQPVSRLILVGGFCGKIGVDQFDSINFTFFEQSFDWCRIKRICRDVMCYYSPTDPYVARWHFDNISHQLHARKIIFSNAGHFNTASGYTTFPHLFSQLKQFIQEE